MRILLVDADSHNGFPNLALMKLSAWLKEINNGNLTIDLIKGIPDTAPWFEPYDKVYVSCIFFQNKERVSQYISQLEYVEIGGSGWDGETHLPLPDPIEHIQPDYSLYGTDFSMGFTSRGCPNNCGFCIVPKKEGPIRDNAPIQEFLDPNHKKLVLLDNNFLASPRWKENLEFIIDNDLKINFNQGLDIRLVNEENAQLLSECKYYNWTWKTKSLHFAFDDLRHWWQVLDGIDTLREAGIKPYRLMFYVLIGWNTYPSHDIERVNLLVSQGAVPYIMTYNQNENEWTKNYERYINGRYYQFIAFEKYMNGVLCRPFKMEGPE